MVSAIKVSGELQGIIGCVVAANVRTQDDQLARIRLIGILHKGLPVI